jgi:hypothetical protein
MARNNTSNNRFEGLSADEEVPVKRMNKMMTPDKFKANPKDIAAPASIGAPALGIQGKPAIERINGHKVRPPAPPRVEQRGKGQANKD